MEDSSFNLQPPTSPRIRPGGPRNRRQNFKSPTPLTLDGGNTSPSDDAVPAYFGRNSPAMSSSRPHSPTPFLASMPSISQLSDPNYAHPRPPAPMVERGVQVSPADLQSSVSTPSRATTPAVKLITKPPTLEPPPSLNFESTAIQWRGLTLEAAQWTFSSQELQDIVSRAIRKSAEESFIRLLSVKTLDEELVNESKRLDHLRVTTQSQYRFNMHRRTMLLQSLVALSAGEHDGPALVNLTTQLADITRSCDRLMEEMLRISDQRCQVQRIQDLHDASALAMALRKLNGSYAKRTAELRDARGRVESLQAELEEAWRVAEDMAQEMDDLENFRTGFSEPEEDEDDSGVGGEVGDDEQYADNDESVRLATVINITGTAVATKATLTNIAEGSNRGESSSKPVESDRASKVSATRKRSSRISKASLRIPRTSGKTTEPEADHSSNFSRGSRSKSRSKKRGTDASPTSHVVVPPVPNSNSHLDPSRKDDSFLIMAETRPGSPSSPVQPESAPPLPSLSQTVSFNEDGDSDPDPETASSRSRRLTTLNFEMPPITISPPEDEAKRQKQAEAKQLPDRRVHSMQPPTARVRSMDDGEVGISTTDKDSKNYKKFDGWPWGTMKKKAKRHSMPMTRHSIESAREDVQDTSARPLSKSLSPSVDTNKSVESAP